MEISTKRRYQLSNRIAFAWKLASMGVPVVLLYLGFTGDGGIRNVGKPLASQDQWDKLIRKHLEAVGAERLLEARTDCGEAGLWFLTRSREVMEPSPPRIG